VLAGIFCDFTTKIMLLCAIFSLSKRLYILLQLVSRLNYFLVVDVNTLAHLRNVQESDYLLSFVIQSSINFIKLILPCVRSELYAHQTAYVISSQQTGKPRNSC